MRSLHARCDRLSVVRYLCLFASVALSGCFSEAAPVEQSSGDTGEGTEGADEEETPDPDDDDDDDDAAADTDGGSTDGVETPTETGADSTDGGSDDEGEGSSDGGSGRCGEIETEIPLVNGGFEFGARPLDGWTATGGVFSPVGHDEGKDGDSAAQMAADGAWAVTQTVPSGLPMSGGSYTISMDLRHVDGAVSNPTFTVAVFGPPPDMVEESETADLVGWNRTGDWTHATAAVDLGLGGNFTMTIAGADAQTVEIDNIVVVHCGPELRPPP